MSRIHEALKKAELERGASRPLEVPVAPVPPATSGGGQERHTTSTATTGLLTEATVAARTESTGRLLMEEILARAAQPQWHPDQSPNVFANPALCPHGAEQFRTLRSRLYQIRGNQRLGTLLITSPAAAEGKTFVTCNLGQAIVRQADRRALLIDADLRCSRLHTALGASTEPGLSDYLRGDADEASVLQHGQPPNLWLIPGGTSVTNPSELLSNGRMRLLLERIAPAFDWVIIDSPPCVPVADASVLADYCDGVLMVVRAGSTPSALVQKAATELKSRNVVGVVMNAVENESMGYQSYYGYGYGQNGLNLTKKK